MNKCYIVTVAPPFYDVQMPIVEAFFAGKKTAQRFKAENILRQEVREICPTDYAITIRLDFGAVAIMAKGFKRIEDGKKALPTLQTLVPNSHFEIVKFSDTALYKQDLGKGGNDD